MKTPKLVTPLTEEQKQEELARLQREIEMENQRVALERNHMATVVLHNIATKQRREAQKQGKLYKALKKVMWGLVAFIVLCFIIGTLA